MIRIQLKKMAWFACLIAASCVLLTVCFESKADEKKEVSPGTPTKTDKDMEIATLGGGCFWCVEAVLEQIGGIQSVKSGYMGGTTKNPTYEQVCKKIGGHIEVVQVTYDPAKIDFDLLLEAFWIIHDPTSKDKQGADKGIQYRSVIFYHDEAQKKAAEASIAKANASGKFSKEIVTELRPVDTYYNAEDYHQNYYKDNPGNGYCNALIPPKLYKLFKDAKFKDKRKDS